MRLMSLWLLALFVLFCFNLAVASDKNFVESPTIFRTPDTIYVIPNTGIVLSDKKTLVPGIVPDLLDLCNVCNCCVFVSIADLDILTYTSSKIIPENIVEMGNYGTAIPERMQFIPGVHFESEAYENSQVVLHTDKTNQLKAYKVNINDLVKPNKSN